MQKEIELKVLNIDTEEIRNKLESLGAKMEGSYFQRRYVFDLMDHEDGKWVRLRSNGVKTTLAYKQINNSSIDGTEEVEIEVDDFDKTLILLKNIGYTPRCYQENRRTSFVLNNVNIEIDEWPLIPAYLEIEGIDKESVLEVLKQLGCNKKDVTSLNTKAIYHLHGIDIQNIERLEFK